MPEGEWGVGWEYLLLTAVTVCVLLTGIRLLRAPNPRFMTVHELGMLEGRIDGLFQVLVAADHIEAPANALRRSVERNLSKGVKYLFLVSRSKAEAELKSYYRIFEVLAQVVIDRERKQLTVSDLVEIQKLPYDWEDYPYVFYRARAMSPAGGVETIAFRGNQVREGIAEGYHRVEPRMAHTIAKALLGGAPEAVREAVPVEKDAFVGAEKVVQGAFRRHPRLEAATSSGGSDDSA